jgi:hypothetical protein
MTEAEWLACKDPDKMLEFLRGKASDRKLRLFACASCSLRHGKHFRTIPVEVGGDPGQKAIQVAELYADGLASSHEAEAAEREASDYGYRFNDETFGFTEASAAYWAAAGLLRESASMMSACPVTFPSDTEEMRAAQAALFREVFGLLPFRPVTLDPAWLTWKDGTIPKLAQTIYEDQELPSGHLDLDRLAVLGDALEDSGCSEPDILGHCRGPGSHVRGCWVIDLILGKG